MRSGWLDRRALGGLCGFKFSVAAKRQVDSNTAALHFSLHDKKKPKIFFEKNKKADALSASAFSWS
jgi:hypothetical protein